MADLTEYDARRDFAKTSEPAGAVAGSQADGDDAAAPRFVVQEHHASTLHWDLRLEHDGVLASWALPRGFPATPDENRLAVHTEDHPLGYLGFHGEIPAGQYGAGTMEIWDAGTYETHSWDERKVVVTFHGERVRGRHALFQAGDDKRWMIHRMDPPDDAQREPLPEGLVPMLAKLAPLPTADAGWAYEVKWDGVRALAYLQPGRLRLESRNLLDVTAQYPELRGLIEAVGAHDVVLDGEIVAFDDQGRPSFERLQQRMHHTSEAEIRRRVKTHPVTYVLFDLLFLDGHPTTGLPYTERRALLEGLGLNGAHCQTPGYATSDGKALLAATAEQGLEGLVAKRLDSVYVPGRRTGAWLKVKNARRQELVIGGWTPGKGERTGELGALLVGHHDGGELRYAGKVGTGMGVRERRMLLDRLKPLARDTSPFAAGARGATAPPRDTRFVEPELVAEIEFGQWTAGGQLRHPVYKGLRTDKEAGDVTREDEEAVEAVDGVEGVGSLTGADRTIEVDGRELKLTNLDKVLYPETGFTKGQLIDYYARIAPVLLPHLRGRPLTLKRFPNGVDEKAFFQKHAAKDRPEWMATTMVAASSKGDIEELLLDSRAGLVWTANRAAIELHTLLAPADAPDRPDALVFDLDPGAPADIVDSARVAQWIRGMLSELGLVTLAKTSGSKGLQLYVPLDGTATHDETKAFALAVAQTLEQRFPDRVVSRMAKAQRPGKVFIDWSQNDEHKTTVNVYSVRARARPTVSTPVTWDEVDAAVEAADAALLAFTTDQVLERVAEQGDLFADLLTVRQELPRLG